jgi:micrococcal nuclease
MKNKNKDLITVFIAGIIIALGLFYVVSNYTIDFNNGTFANGSTQSTKNRNPKSNNAKQLGNIEEVSVSRVVDGDTVELKDGRKIRYLNVDTPETVKPNTIVMCFGIEAKKFNQEMVLNKTLFMKYDREKTDQYGRTLGFIYFDRDDANSNLIEKTLNYILVKNGFGRAVFYSPNTTYRPQFMSAYQEASNKKLGAHNSCPKPFVE